MGSVVLSKMIFVWALLLTAALVGNAEGSARIVGGQYASIQEFPSLTQVEFRNVFLFWSQTCAANIITPRFLVTVAHCFGGFLFSINQRRIRAGATYRNDGGAIFELDSYIAHPSYGRNDFDGDIAILRLTRTMSYGLGIQPIALAGVWFEVPDHSPVVHAGWGATGIGGSGGWSTYLRRTQVLTINNELCASRYRRLSRSPQVTENMICAGILNVSDRDSCEGDDGGPMYYNGTVLLGIVSWGRSCADAFYPRVNTKVSSYASWIRENTS